VTGEELEKRNAAMGISPPSMTVKIEALRMVPGERDRAIVPGPDDPQ